MGEIELRWIERSAPALHLGKNISVIVRVLQFRENRSLMQGMYCMSEWQDVPTVKEGDDLFKKAPDHPTPPQGR